MPPQKLTSVRNLVVSRQDRHGNDLGKIEFLDDVNVAGLDFEATFTINGPEDGKQGVTVDSANNEQFKRIAARVTLNRVFPKDKHRPGEPLDTSHDGEYRKFAEKLQKACDKNDGQEHISYDRDSHTWTFKVKHW